MYIAETDSPPETGTTFGPAGRFLLALTKNLAITGGLVFVGLVVMSIVYWLTVVLHAAID